MRVSLQEYTARCQLMSARTKTIAYI